MNISSCHFPLRPTPTSARHPTQADSEPAQGTPSQGAGRSQARRGDADDILQQRPTLPEAWATADAEPSDSTSSELVLRRRWVSAPVESHGDVWRPAHFSESENLARALGMVPFHSSVAATHATGASEATRPDGTGSRPE